MCLEVPVGLELTCDGTLDTVLEVVGLTDSPRSKLSSRCRTAIFSRIPDGTEVWFRRRAAVVAGGALLLDGEEYRTPFAAGAAVTHGIQVNGWLVRRTLDGKSLADFYEEL